MKPQISINLALSADGKISDLRGRPSQWTSAEDGARLLELRRGADALMVGRKTWLADQMTMCVPGAAAAPLRCIVSRRGELPEDHPIFQAHGGRIHVLCTESAPLWKDSGNDVRFHEGDMERFLHTLASELEVRRLHCEGGGWLVNQLFKIGAVDTLFLTLAGHTMFGGRNAPTVTGPPCGFTGSSMEMRLVEWAPRAESGECYLTYRRAGEGQCS